MSSKSTLPVVLKTEPQKSMPKRLLILSRIPDGEWNESCIFYDEKQAQQEYVWLKNHNKLKEYLLVAQIVVEPSDLLADHRKEVLDDNLPF